MAATATWSSPSAAAPAPPSGHGCGSPPAPPFSPRRWPKGGGVDLAFVNPSALLTQAYRGVGLFRAPLPVRIVAVYPSWDRFVFMVHPRTGIRSLADIKAKRYPLRVSVREDPTHSTLVLIEQAFALHGFALKDIESWGGRLVTLRRAVRRSPPRAARARRDRRGVRRGHQGLARRGAGGRSRADRARGEPSSKPWGDWDGARSRFRKRASLRLARDVDTLDFSGWPIYANASLPDDVAYDVCAALAAREAEIPWEKGTSTTAVHMGRESETTPMDVPLHPGAERWYREHGQAD